MEEKARTIILAAILTELPLFVLGLGWMMYSRNYTVPLPEPRSIGIGVLLTIPPLIFNLILVDRLAEKLRALRQIRDFAAIARQFVEGLSVWQALLLSALAATGEEVFFRGALQPETGNLLASVIFAFAHLFLAVRRYPLVFLLYTALSCYIGYVFEATGSLAAVMMLHFCYDFAAIMLLQHWRAADRQGF